MLFAYNIALRFYGFLIRMASFFNPKAKQFIEGRRGVLTKIKSSISHEQRKVIWLHCASLGEFEQGRPVLEAIREKYPQYLLLLTFFSPSGYEVRKDYKGADYIFYLPIDSRRHARDFIRYTKPALALFVKYEFWYHYLQALQQENSPTILFSAFFQKNQPFFRFYGGLYRKMLTFYQQIFVQDEQSLKLLGQIGQKNVQIAGDTRFDRTARVKEHPTTFANVATFCESHSLIVAGSTWPEDGIFLKKALDSLPEHNFRLLIVPHEVQPQNIERIQKLFGSEACLWQSEEKVLKDKKVAIVDSVGHLSFLYRYAAIAWIGGGFGKGIHNIIEPAIFGIPIFFGGNYHRFREAREMIAADAAATISKPAELSAVLLNQEKLKQMGENAEKYVQQQTGATQTIMAYLSEKCLDKIS